MTGYLTRMWTPAAETDLTPNHLVLLVPYDSSTDLLYREPGSVSASEVIDVEPESLTMRTLLHAPLTNPCPFQLQAPRLQFPVTPPSLTQDRPTPISDVVNATGSVADLLLSTATTTASTVSKFTTTSTPSKESPHADLQHKRHTCALIVGYTII